MNARRGHCSVEGDGCSDVGECFMSVVIFESNAEVLAEGAELIIGGWGIALVFVKEPESPLVRAEHPGVGG